MNRSDRNKDRLRFCYFSTMAPGGIPSVSWRSPQSRNFDYLDLDHWVKLVRELERAKFDAIFWADHAAAHDTYEGSWEPALRNAVQFPIGDATVLAATLTGSTDNLGFVFSSNIIQDQPF